MRRRRARRLSHLFLGAALVIFLAKVVLTLAFGDFPHDSNMVLAFVFFTGLGMREAAWVAGYDAGLRERTEETET